MSYIGCSGYYYGYWKNRFYPQGLPPKQWLEHYSSVFNTVELNGTFYRKPQLSALKNYAAVTSDQFRFSAKMSRFITHIQRLRDCRQTILEFQDLLRDGLGEKMLHFLFQLPPSFHFSFENLENLLEAVPHHTENVVEFRHASWWNGEVQAALSAANITFCNIDFPGMEVPFVQTTDQFYLRLHGNPVLFKSSYETEKLEEFCRRIPADVQHRCVYFNNTYYEAGYLNAMELQRIVNALCPPSKENSAQ